MPIWPGRKGTISSLRRVSVLNIRIGPLDWKDATIFARLAEKRHSGVSYAVDPAGAACRQLPAPASLRHTMGVLRALVSLSPALRQPGAWRLAAQARRYVGLPPGSARSLDACVAGLRCVPRVPQRP